MSEQNVREKKSSMALIWLCWLVYSCSYVGKVNFKANINLLQEYFEISDYSKIGIVSSLFFFSYGIGQVVNGLWCKKYNIKIADIESKKRNREFSHPRQIAMYLCRKMTDASLKNIGALLGKRDHTTIINGHNKIEAEIKTNASIKNNIDIIMKKINPM